MSPTPTRESEGGVVYDMQYQTRHGQGAVSRTMSMGRDMEAKELDVNDCADWD